MPASAADGPAEASALRDPIVVGVALRDEDQAPLRLAAEFARLTGAGLVLVHASPYDPLIAVSPPDWEREALDRAAAALEELAAPLRPVAQVTVQARPDPSPVRALHEAAEELGAWLLAVGRSHRGAIGRIAPGGIGERLLHAAPCAVAVAPTLRGADPPVLRRIGVAYID